MSHLIDCVLPVQPALDPPAARRRVDHRRVGAAARARLGGGRRGRLPPCRCSIHHIKPRNTSISKGITLPVVFFDTVDLVGFVNLDGADVSDLLSSADSVRFCLLGGGGFLAVMSFDDGLNIHSLLNATNTWHQSHH